MPPIQSQYSMLQEQPKSIERRRLWNEMNVSPSLPLIDCNLDQMDPLIQSMQNTMILKEAPHKKASSTIVTDEKRSDQQTNSLGQNNSQEQVSKL